MRKIDEFTVDANVVTPDSRLLRKGRKKKSRKDEITQSRNIGPLAGVKIDTKKYDASFRTKGKDSPVQKHRKAHPKKTHLHKRGFGEAIAHQQFETVRRKGTGWALYDDKTGAEIGVYQNRSQAWQAQRFARARKSKQNEGLGRKVQKTPNPFQRDQHHKKQPKVKKGLGTKHVKAIRPLKPVKPKALKSASRIGENMRRLTIEEIKTLIIREAKKQGITESTLVQLRSMMAEPKDPSKMKIKQAPWDKAEHTKLTKWVSALGLKEMLQPK